MKKQCAFCKAEKILEEFPIHSIKDNKVYYRTNCKVCDRQYRSNYRNNHPEIKEYQKIYKKTYYENNKAEQQSYQRNYLKLIRGTNPSRRLRENVSRSILYHLTKNSFSKDKQSCIKHLTYSIEELKIHLESQFDSWMDWNNYGSYVKDNWNDNDQSTWTWQIDHIVPHSTFQYSSMEDEEFQQCWSLKNLRPLSSKQNLLDGVFRNRH